MEVKSYSEAGYECFKMQVTNVGKFRYPLNKQESTYVQKYLSLCRFKRTTTEKFSLKQRKHWLYYGSARATADIGARK